jgi:hypothetical protein
MAFCNSCGQTIDTGILCGQCASNQVPAATQLPPAKSSPGLNRAVKLALLGVLLLRLPPRLRQIVKTHLAVR